MDEEDLEKRRKAERAPVEEAGGGVSEGFEQSEQELIEQATHGSPGTSPTQDRFTPEEDEARLAAEAGEADEVEHPDS